MRYAAGNEMGVMARLEKVEKEEKPVMDQKMVASIGVLNMADAVNDIKR